VKYRGIEKGIFLSRPNRFTAWAEFCGQTQFCHVKNTGRLGELLVPGTEIYAAAAGGENRKTAWDIVAVNKQGRLVNIDSQAPNWAAAEFLQKQYPLAHIRREVAFEDSRFDFLIEGSDFRRFVEVKGVTLEKNGLAMFPDAPTLRGRKHLQGLIRAKQRGYDACVLFVVQMKGVFSFAPNRASDAAFAAALKKAAQNGVDILAYDCRVGVDFMEIDKPVKVEDICSVL